MCLNGTQPKNEDSVKTSSLSRRNILWSLSERWVFDHNFIATQEISILICPVLPGSISHYTSYKFFSAFNKSASFSVFSITFTLKSFISYFGAPRHIRRVIVAKRFCFQPKVKFQPIFALGGSACWLDLEYILIVISKKFWNDDSKSIVFR